ncbi:IS3 family transposase [Mesorhizobium sp. M0047]|uniref:IS3 family transposase n=1 Tax=Mesorhizobium sp. M0047 TaxID=2956859 RepID=UPI003335FE6B
MPNLSVRRQCQLLQLSRSGVYRPQSEVAANDLALMRGIDELHLELPFYGSRRMTFELNDAGHAVNRKHVQRLMRMMGIVALVPRPGTSHRRPGTRSTPICCVAWRSPSPTMCGRATNTPKTLLAGGQL